MRVSSIDVGNLPDLVSIVYLLGVAESRDLLQTAPSTAELENVLLDRLPSAYYDLAFDLFEELQGRR